MGQDRVLKKKNHAKHGTQFDVGPKIHPCKEESVMRCHRCKGIMIYEKFYGDCEHFFGWRCVVCGEIVDQVILENRLENMR